MELSELLKTRRNEILKIAEKYGARNLRLFGSAARGDADENSDVDLLVEMDQGRSLFDMGGMLMELEALLGRKVDIVTEKGLKKRIRERVMKEAVPL